MKCHESMIRTRENIRANQCSTIRRFVMRWELNCKANGEVMLCGGTPPFCGARDVMATSGTRGIPMHCEFLRFSRTSYRESLQNLRDINERIVCETEKAEKFGKTIKNRSSRDYVIRRSIYILHECQWFWWSVIEAWFNFRITSRFPWRNVDAFNVTLLLDRALTTWILLGSSGPRFHFRLRYLN